MTNKQKQCILKYFDCYNGIIDGEWGPLSAEGTGKLQRKLGIPDDNVFGPQTEAAARKVIGEGWDLQAEKEADSDVTDTNVGDTGLWNRVRHFDRREFRCPCGKCGGFPVEPSEEIVLAADDMREAFGSPVIIVPEDGHSGGSGVRCQEYNDSLKGSVPNSKHVDGDAVDFSAPGKSASAIEGYLTEAQKKGKIYYWYKITDGSYHMEV